MEYENMNDSRELAVRGRIRRSRLQRNQYTASLLNEGLHAGLLTSQDTMRIQNGLMQILQERIRQYTRGESTSVTTETAESILASIMYALDAYLLGMDNPEKAITYLITADVRGIYDKGVKSVGQCFEESNRLYRDIRASKLDVPVDAYQMTIDESLPIFLRKYDMIFEAHNTMASIDYPLAVDDMRLQGVYYIRQYLGRLKLENEFCLMFDRQELLNLLKQYGRVCRFDYRIELFNIFELVLHQAVFSLLSGGGADHIVISKYQYERLEQQFMRLDLPQIRSVITEAMSLLQEQLSIHTQLRAYMNECKEEFVQRTAHAAKNGSLQAVIVAEREEGAKSTVISFNIEDRMSDAKLRKLLHDIAACEKQEDKVKLIVTSVHSLHDYLDLLDADCLYGDEYEALFRALGDVELAILAKIVLVEELRNEALDLPSVLCMDKDYPTEWQLQWVRFMQTIEAERVQAVEKLMGELYEE